MPTGQTTPSIKIYSSKSSTKSSFAVSTPGPIQCSAAWVDGISMSTRFCRDVASSRRRVEMKGWDRWADLPKIKVRTLTMGARYDEMDPEDMRKMATLLPQGEAWISETGSHFAMYDDQRNYFTALLGFLKA